MNFCNRTGRRRFAGLIAGATAAFFMLGIGTVSAEIGASPAVSTGLKPCVDPTVSPDQVVTPCTAIVRFADGVTAAGRSNAIRGAGAVFRIDLGRFNAASAVVPNDAAFWSLAGDSRVLDIHPNRRLRALAPPGRCSPWPACKNSGDTTDTTDTGSTQVVPSGVDRIGARDTGLTGAGVGIAIVDTGVDLTNPDLTVSLDCFVAFQNDDCGDGHGHGTHVSGIAAAKNNNIDVVGVAPEATIYAVKVLDDNGFGNNATVAAGLQWVLANWDQVTPHIRVVNMSLGNSEAEGKTDCYASDNEVLHDAINDLVAAGVTVVAAAGNTPSWDVTDTVPGGCPGVISVASTSADKGKSRCKRFLGDIRADTASFFTTDGPTVTISAPGEQKQNNSCSYVTSVGIESLAIGGGTTRKSGTSMSAPHVAGIAALMLQQTPGLSPAAVSSGISSTADGRGTAPLDSPTTSYTFDGTREGVVDACGLFGCP